MTLVVGVDGGGTKTHAVVADETGAMLGFATHGPSNWESVGLRGALDALREAISNALHQAGASSADVAGAAFGLAGVDWESDMPRMRGVIDQLRLPCMYELVNDSFIALRAGTDSPMGVVLVAGTGAVAAGRNRDGRTFRTLGEGPVLGDVGAASDVSDAAVRAVADAYTGRGPGTVLTEELCGLTGCETAAEFLEWYSRGVEPIRNAAPAVVRAAQEGDPVAQGIMRWAGSALGASAALVARQLEMTDEEFDVVLSGGLFRAGSAILNSSLEGVLHPVVPRARLVQLDPPPAVGAVLLALDGLGERLDGAARRRLEDSAKNAVVQRPWLRPA
ncbi:MAG: BadF/BadG/BcrA/BcrD ATPase family protein [Gaiellales bacterium]